MFKRVLLVVLFLTSCSVMAMHHAGGKPHKTGVIVEDTWSPAAPPTVPVRAGYFIVKNKSTQTITLVGAESPVFKRVELHETVIKDGLSTMSRLESVIIEAGETVKFEPGGKHLMLMQAKGEIPGVIPVTLKFIDGKAVNIDLAVQKKGADSGMSHHHHK